ncbi:MAG: lipocalin-like domain-containing protein [Planctomycetaceae bacterium]|nr:lipocalin-like domain-containing protein [Planctomycetales bacterium]MCB9925222.1 lipocalin-like domain-containing protein [Planctomycetaceae bacterium]
MSRQQFLGTWKLVSSEMVTDDDVIYPLGKHCVGIITFDDFGKLNGQMMNVERPKFASNDMLRGTPEEMQAAYQGYVAFWANYTVDEEQGTMSYTVEGSLFPNWVGHQQERHYKFDGNRLTLETSPLSLGGKENVVGVLVWEKLT